MFDKKLIFSIIKGIITFIPGANCIINTNRKNTHSSSSALFCYNLWGRIYLLLKENNINSHFDSIAEIGTAGSYGVGFCSILTGTKKFTALEIENNFNIEENLKLLEEIFELFKNRTKLTNNFPQLNIPLEAKHVNTFPFEEIDINTLKNKKALIEISLKEQKKTNLIETILNWEDKSDLNFDFIYSRAVMEHVNMPENIYKKIYENLKTNNYMLHDIELHSHDLTSKLNGHLRISSLLWKIIKGKRKYFLNRTTAKEHQEYIIKNNFKLSYEKQIKKEGVDFGYVVIAKKINN